MTALKTRSFETCFFRIYRTRYNLSYLCQIQAGFVLSLKNSFPKSHFASPFLIRVN